MPDKSEEVGYKEMDGWQKNYACCEEAVLLKNFYCVCSCVMNCSEHGLKHHGTHD